MNLLKRVVLVFTTFVLLFATISAGSYADLQNFSSTSQNDSQPAQYYFESGLSLYCFQTQRDNSISPFEKLQPFSYQIQPNLNSGGNFVFEHKLFSTGLQYFAYIAKIRYSLPIRCIIFPFHYFW